jgi:hypothetical protein
MTRGLGSALGVSVAGLIFSLLTGGAGNATLSSAVDRGFAVAVGALAVAAVIAAVAAAGDKTALEAAGHKSPAE